MCNRGLETCVRLKCCTLTRDRSLTSNTLKSLAKCPELTDISINGWHFGLYEPEDLLHLLHLHKISLISPSIHVLEVLPSWIQATGKSLTSLALICEVNFLITDTLLNSTSPHLSRLESLHLAGCPRVTNEGVWSLIRNNIRGLKELSLKELPPLFDMSALSADCARAGGLTLLSFFTFSVHPKCSTYEWMDGTVSLLRKSPLESVQFNASSLLPNKRVAATLGDRFCMGIVDQHRDHLIGFSLHGLQLHLPSIDHICLHCAKLEQLFICVDHAGIPDMTPLIAVLARATHLRAVHITFNGRPEMCSPYVHALSIARQCSPTISQVGIETKVWKVERRVFFLNGTAEVDRVLTSARNPDIPEQFLVVHT